MKESLLEFQFLRTGCLAAEEALALLSTGPIYTRRSVSTEAIAIARPQNQLASLKALGSSNSVKLSRLVLKQSLPGPAVLRAAVAQPHESVRDEAPQNEPVI